MKRLFEVLLVVGVISSMLSLYFLINKPIYSIFLSVLGVMIIGFSAFELIRLKRLGIVDKKKEKPIASKAKKDEDDISWTYYDFEETKKEDPVKPAKIKHAWMSKIVYHIGLRKTPKVSGKQVEVEMKIEKKKSIKNQEKDKWVKLIDYITDSMKKNIPKKSIIEACLASDWPRDKIDQAIARIESGGSRKSRKSFAILIVVTLILAIGLMMSGSFLIGYWLDSLKLISRVAYYAILLLIIISFGIILLDIKDRVRHNKKVYKLKKTEEVEEIEEELKEKQSMVVEDGTGYKTDMDKLLDLVNERKKLPIDEVSSIFKISKKEAEEWGKILKEEGLISLYYPTVGDVELRKKEKVKKKEE